MGASHSKQTGGNKMEDTVTLARQEREKQGSWEVEVSYGGQEDLQRHLASCKKNPGHQNFIPIDKFNVEHLPPGYQDNDVVDLVRAMSDLTVRVSVKYVSDSGPETAPRSDKPFPCYMERGRDMMRAGTGFVYDVTTYPNRYDDRYTTCVCKECVNSPTPKTQFAHINMRTAAHIISDNMEAAHTTCHLFFDKGESPEFCSGVVTLSGLSLVWRDLEKDCCCVRYVTHDRYLAYRLNTVFAQYKSLSDRLRDKYISLLSTKPHLSIEQGWSRYALSDNSSDYREAIIVSHPHGCSKQVSIGRCTNLEEREDGRVKYTYTTPTCPGSSGAHVCVIDKMGGWSPVDYYVHSGGQCEGHLQLNFSNYEHFIM